MAVFVKDHLGVLSVVDASLAEAKLVLVGRRERVVETPLVDANALRLLVHRTEARSEAEALDVLLGLGDPVVGHHLLELVLRAVVLERVGRRVRGVPGLADDDGPVARQESASVEVRERAQNIRGLKRGVVLVVLVGERLILQLRHRIRKEHAAAAGARARPGLRRVGDAFRHHEQRDDSHEDGEMAHEVPPR